MPLSNPMLWHRISQFSLDKDGISLPFSKRLADENSWTTTFAKHAIEEYKKFVYLACVSNTPVTPSDEIDQVWHLHLAYTRSYWDDFCAHTLQRKLHHGPTKGGSTEGTKFHSWYEHTKTRYAEEFDASPRLDLWPVAEERFSRPLHRKRIDTANYWMIRKPILAKTHLVPAMGVAASVLLLAGCSNQTIKEPWLTLLCVGIIIVGILITAGIDRLFNGSGGGGCSGWFGGCGNDDSGDSGCGGD